MRMLRGLFASMLLLLAVPAFAQTTLIDDTFTTGADQTLQAYNATYVKRVGGANNIDIRASDDVVLAGALASDIVYIYDSTAMAKTRITATVIGSTPDVTSYPGFILRGTRTGNFNAYAVEFEDTPGGNGEVGIYRITNGTFDPILADVKGTTGSLPNNVLTTVVIDIDDSGGNPVIGVKVGAGTRATYTDSSGSKITGTGHGGIYFYSQGDVANARTSALKIENLDTAGGSGIILKRRKH
jgi:hypothetical protein